MNEIGNLFFLCQNEKMESMRERKKFCSEKKVEIKKKKNLKLKLSRKAIRVRGGNASIKAEKNV